MRRGPVWSPKGMAIRSGAGNSLSRHSQNQTTTCGLLSIHRFFPLLPQTYQVHLLTFCFNPHTHERCDMINTNDIAYAVMFQSTHPRGVRPHIQKCIEYQYAKLCFLRHNAKLLKTRHIRHRRKRQPTDFQRLR